jgi:hypothetical protein
MRANDQELLALRLVPGTYLLRLVPHLSDKAGWFGIILLTTGEADYAPCLTC